VAGLVLGQYGVFIAMTTAFQTALLSGGLVLVLPLAVWLGAARRRRSSVATTALAVQTRSDASVSGFRNGPNLPEQA
jgi:cytochrome c-type biogenesis protein CcmH/NrfF